MQNKSRKCMITCKEKTREELIAGIKRAIERKRAFEEEAQKEFADMRRRAAAQKEA
ncbi:MAG: 30S ribosomal protein S7 [Segatella oris]